MFGKIDAIDLSLLLHLVVFLFTNAWIWLGIAFLLSSLVFYLIAISWLELSYVLPIHASSYVLDALFAWLILGERISEARWISTLSIAIGVLFVGLSEVSSINQAARKKEKSDRIFQLFPFSFGLYLSKTWLAVIVLSLADSAGDLFLAIGMKQVGQVRIKPGRIFKLIHQIVTTPAIIWGISCQAIAFAIFISVLTWADLSFVRPATALTYVFSLLGARYILKEKVAARRLIGIVFIGIGIFIHQ